MVRLSVGKLSLDALVLRKDAVSVRVSGGEVVSAGKYQCKIIPVIHEREGLIKLRISTVSGYKWKLNAIF